MKDSEAAQPNPMFFFFLESAEQAKSEDKDAQASGRQR